MSCPAKFCFILIVKKVVVVSLVNSIKIEKSIRDGDLIFLAKLEAIKETTSNIKYILIVNEFMFLKLVGLFPDIEVEFTINVQPRTTPIVKTPF